MPIIPLLTQTDPTPNLPAPVLDHQQRPTINNQPTEAALGAFGDAAKMPLLPGKELAAPYDALGSVGKAIQDAGSIAGALAIKKAEAETYVQTTKADAQLDVTRQQFETWREQHPDDPSSWMDQWHKMAEPVVSQVLADPNLRPKAREQIQLRSELWQNKTTAAIDTAAATKTFDLARQANEGEIANAIEAQDKPAMDAAVEKGTKAGWLFDWKKEHYEDAFTKKGEILKKKAEADAFDTAQNTVATIAAGKGAEAAQKAIDDGTVGNFAPADAEKLRSYAKTVADERGASSMSSLLDGVYSGKITNPARIDELAQQDPHLTPKLVEAAKEDLRKLDLRAANADKEQNGVLHAVELRHAAEDYNRADDKDGTQFFTLKAAIKRSVPEGMGNEISNLLDQKYSGNLGKLPAAPENVHLVEKTLADVFNPINGVLPWKTPEVKRYPEDTTTGFRIPLVGSFVGLGGTDHKQGEPVLDDKGNPQPLYNKNGQPEKYITDWKAKEQAEEQEAAITGKMRTWMQANPDQANDPKAVTNKLMEFVPEGARGAMYQSTLQKTLAPQTSTETAVPTKLTSYGYQGDSTPDGNSKAGIGAFVPKEEAIKIRAGQDSWFKLRAGDIAASPDVEKAFMAKGIAPGDLVAYQLSNGEVRKGRFMDRTAQDDQIKAGKVKGVTQPLRGRIDAYSPTGKDKADGVRVVKWWKPQEVASNE